MNKHTPGPWTCSIDECATVRDGKDNQLAMVTYLHTRTGGRRHGDEVAANARLISSAPELLEALESAIDSDGGTHYDGEDDEVGERSCCGEVSYKPHLHGCWVVKARAAIAKAKGQTP